MGPWYPCSCGTRSVVQNATPSGGADGFAFGSAAYAVKWSGSPVSAENAAALGNSRFSSAAGLGVVKMRSAAAATATPQESESTSAASFFRLFIPGGLYNRAH